MVYREDAKAAGWNHPLPITSSYDENDSFCATVTSPNASKGIQVKEATSGKSIYITDLIISTNTALVVDLVDDAGTSVVENLYFSANSIYSKSFMTPLKVTSGKALNIKTSLAAPISITVSGSVR